MKIVYTLESDNVLKQEITPREGKKAFFRREFYEKGGKMVSKHNTHSTTNSKQAIMFVESVGDVRSHNQVFKTTSIQLLPLGYNIGVTPKVHPIV